MANNAIKYIIEVDSQTAIKGVKNFENTASSAGGTVAKSWLKAGAAVTAFAAAAAGALAFKGAKRAVSDFQSLEKELANVSTLVDTSKINMTAMKEELLKLPAILGSSTELTKGLYQAISGGVEPAKAVQFVAESAKAAKAGLSDVFTAVDAGTTIMNAYGQSAEGITGINDRLFTAVKAGKTTYGELASSIGKVATIAAQAGVSQEELFAALATTTKAGINTSESVTNMKAAFSNIFKPQSKATDMAEELGIEFSATALKAKGLVGFLEEIGTKTGGSVEKMAQLFGSVQAVSSIMSLTTAGKKDFLSIFEDMKKSSGVTAEAFTKQSATLDSGIDRMKNSMEKISQLVGEKIAPAINKIVNGISNWIEKNQDLINSGIEKFLGGTGDAFNGIKEVLEALKPVFEFLKTLWDALVITFKALEPILRLVWEVFKLLLEVLRPVVEFLGSMIGKLGEVTEKFNKMIEPIKNATAAVKGFFGSSTPEQEEAMEKMMELSAKFAQEQEKLFKAGGGKKGFAGVGDKEASKEAINNIKKVREEYAKLIKDLAISAGATEKEALKMVVTFLGEGSSIMPLSDKIKEMGGLMAGLGQEIADATPALKVDFEGPGGEALSTSLNTVKSGFDSMFDNMIDGTLNVKDAFTDMSISILKSLGDMLKNQAIQGLLNLVVGAFGGGSTPYIPALAGGGTAQAGMPHMVGERGPELFIPNRTGTVVPNSQMGGGGASMNVTNNISVNSSGGTTEREDRNQAKQIAMAIDQQMKRVIATERRPGGILNPVTTIPRRG